jgi:hypothetical protein
MWLLKKKKTKNLGEWNELRNNLSTVLQLFLTSSIIARWFLLHSNLTNQEEANKTSTKVDAKHPTHKFKKLKDIDQFPT